MSLRTLDGMEIPSPEIVIIQPPKTPSPFYQSKSRGSGPGIEVNIQDSSFFQKRLTFDNERFCLKINRFYKTQGGKAMEER